jgi:hypothetical protein
VRGVPGLDGHEMLLSEAVEAGEMILGLQQPAEDLLRVGGPASHALRLLRQRPPTEHTKEVILQCSGSRIRIFPSRKCLNKEQLKNKK